jgi:hypothetical protein
MNKKEYTKPQVEVVKLESNNLLAGSPPAWSGEGGSPEFELDEDIFASPLDEIDAFFAL